MYVAARRTRRTVLLMALFCFWLLAMAAVAVLGRSGRVPDVVGGVGLLVLSAVGCATTAVAAVRPWPELRTRRAWRLLAAAHVLLLLSNVLFATVQAFPGPGDVVRLLAGLLFIAGLLGMPTLARTRSESGRLALDIGVVGCGGAMAIWYWSLGPLVTTTGIPVSALVVALAYLVTDLVLLLAAATTLLRGLPSARQRPVGLLVVGLGLLIVADLQNTDVRLAAVVAGGDGDRATTALWLTLLTAFFVLTWAGLEQCLLPLPAQGTPVAAERRAATRLQAVAKASLLPYAALALGYGLLLTVALPAGLYPWGGLALGAVVMTGCVCVRQQLVLRENHALLMTDHLTGLASRAQLHVDLDLALLRARPGGWSAAVLLIDLDDFKVVNDELGHEAGDQLLVAIALLLRDAVSAGDTVGRLGGDEFAVVLPRATPASATAVAERLGAAIRTPVLLAGRPVTVGGSVGVAVSRPAETGQDLLQRADQAMYRAKRAQGVGWALHPGSGGPGWASSHDPGQARAPMSG
jgi:diguanylate cyclase (GGDEF)-like protein